MNNALVIVPGQISPISTRKNIFSRFSSKFFTLFSFSADTDYSSSHTATPSNSNSLRGAKKHFKKNKLFYIPVAIAVVLVLFFVVKIIGGSGSTATSAVAGTSDKKIDLKKARATQSLNKTYSFPINDANGKEVSKLKMTFTNAELRDEIVIQGQKATSIKGRQFLVLDIKLTNDYNKPISIGSRDYVRLSVNGSEEKLAGGIHNDPVEVQPISTEYTKLGFAINENDKDLTLYIGEINGKKEEIKLNLQ